MNQNTEMKKHSWNKRISLIFYAAVLAALFAIAIGCAKKAESPKADEGRKITLIELTGSASVERGGETLAAERDMALQSGDVIVTGENGSARIRMDDDKFLYLDASSRVILAADGTADSSQTIVFVEKGAALTEVKRKLNESSSFDVLTPNSAMAIRGTKTLTEVYEDILGAIKTNAAVVEGQVTFKTVQKGIGGQAAVVSFPIAIKEGFSVTTQKEYLLPQKESKESYGRVYDWYNAVSVPDAKDTTHEEQGATLETPEFSAEFLTNCVAVLARSREEDVEEGFAAENVTEEELNAAINVLNDVIDGKIELPAAVEEYIISQGQPYYEDPITPDQPTKGDSEDEPTVEPEPQSDAADETSSEAHVHDLTHHDGKEATCTASGYKAYDTCKTCDYTTYEEIPALGHEFGAWTVTTEPYPVYDGEFLSTWHAGEKTRKCTRCTETEKAVALVTPVLKAEMVDTVTSLPVDYFSQFGRNPVSAGTTLKAFGTEFFWVTSPAVPGNPFDWVGIDDAVLEWVEGSTAIASLQPGNVIHLKITIPQNLRDVYEDTVVTITLTEAHKHVWSEGFADPEDPTKVVYCCEICGEERREEAETIEIGD